MSDKEDINKILSKTPNLWNIKNKPNDFSYIDSLFSYLSKIKKDISKISKIGTQTIPYNYSFFHYILYYTYYPKEPFIFYKKDSLIFGAFTDKKFKQVEFSFPLFQNPSTALNHLDQFLSNKEFYSILKKYNTKNILLRDIDDDFVNLLRNSNNNYNFRLKSLKELNYNIYDLKKTLDLTGEEFSNLRWHLNKFKNNNYKVEEIPLSDAVKPVIHLIGKWRKKATRDRGFSYVNVSSDKLAARLFSNIEKYFLSKNVKNLVDPENILSKVLKINGEVAAFSLGFPLGLFNKQKIFAHSVGISDISISHLAEYAQYDFWKKVKEKGYQYINDGPTWKNDLETYKNKFRPIKKEKYYWASISLKK